MKLKFAALVAARGAATSKLIQMLRQGHHDVKLPPADFIKPATWVDINLPELFSGGRS